MKLETPECSLDRFNSNYDETIADTILLYYRGSSMAIGNSSKPRSMCSAFAPFSKRSSAPRTTNAENLIPNHSSLPQNLCPSRPKTAWSSKTAPSVSRPPKPLAWPGCMCRDRWRGEDQSAGARLVWYSLDQ